MSRLRRLVLSDRFFFVTCNVLRGRRFLCENEFSLLARAIGWRRKVHGFLLPAWVLLPDQPWPRNVGTALSVAVPFVRLRARF